MDLRTQISLVAAILCFAIAAVVLLRPRKRRVHWLFAAFDSTVGAWYLTTFLARLEGGGAFWGRLNLVWAVLLPLSAVQFFRAFLQSDTRRSGQLNRSALFLALGMIVTVFTPIYQHIALGVAVFSYVFVLLSAALVIVYRAGRRARSRFDRARLLYLALVGTFAAVFTLAEYLPYVGVEIPPVGTVLILVFLYVLAQSILSHRILDLYELAGRLAILTALSFSLAGVLWVLVRLDPGHFFLHSVSAALVLLLVTEPVQQRVERQIWQFFFRERHDFERTIGDLRRQLANVLSIDDLVHDILTAFEGSRRLTHGAIYLLDGEGMGYDLSGRAGAAPPGEAPEPGGPARRIEVAPSRPFLDRLRREEALVLENLERELEERRELGEHREAETVAEILSTMELLRASVAVGMRGQDETYGLICIRDDRLRDAYSPEEVQLLKGLAAQASIAVENSRLYQRMKDRDRLASLGEMAAGLAHEIRNPLGSIKASAQFLSEPAAATSTLDPGSKEFLDIIVEEVDRLNRVVSSFLDYARPAQGGDVPPIDVNATVRRTMHLLAPQLGEGVESKLDLGAEIPGARIDAERLRQVLINLALNAMQAMEGHGHLTVRTRTVERTGKRWIEIHVADTGPGIPQKVLTNLFVPFVTTKERGTGLGLAISQRIISAASGLIEARSSAGIGTTFVVRLPADEPSAAAEAPRASEPHGIGSASSEAGRTMSSSGSTSSPSDPGAAPRELGPAGAGDRASNLASSR